MTYPLDINTLGVDKCLMFGGARFIFFFPSALIVSRALLYRRYSDERLYLRLLYFLNFSARICTHQTVICVFKQ